MKEAGSLRESAAILPVAMGTAVYLFCGIAVAILASTSLTADDYVNYVSFVSISGIVVLGIGTAIEQETNLVYLRYHGDARAIWRFMIPRIVVLVACLWLAVLMPIGSWQTKVFGDLASVVRISVIIGTPGLFFTCVARGMTNSRADFHRLGKGHAVFGLSTVLAPLALTFGGMPLSHSLIIGQTIAWSAPLTILIRSLGINTGRPATRSDAVPHLSGWLVATNIALLSNLLSSQLIFRVRGETLAAEVIAEAQILIMVSCFAASLSLSFMPQLIVAHQKTPERRTSRATALERVFLLGGMVLPLGAAIFRDAISGLLLPTESTIPLVESLLICMPAWFLVIAILFSARFISRERVRSTAVYWLVGLAALWFFPVIVDESSLRSLSVSLFVGAMVPALVFLVAVLLPEKIRHV